MGDLAFPGIGRRGAALPAVDDARRIAELERKIGQVTMENDFLKKALQHFQGASPASCRQWRGCLFEEIRQGAAKGYFLHKAGVACLGNCPKGWDGSGAVCLSNEI